MTKGIRKRGQAWVVDVTYRGRRKTVTCHTEEEAKATRAEIYAELVRGGGRQVGAKSGKMWTVGETYDRITSTAAPEGWRDAKAEIELARNGRAVVDHFGRSAILNEVCLAQIEVWIAEMEGQRASNGTINRKLAALSKMFSFAFKRSGVDKKPHIPRRREPQGRIRFLTWEEEEAVLGEMERLGMYNEADAVKVLIDTGMRYGELLRLERRDIDWDRGTITIWVNKSDQPRTIPMTERVRSTIECRSGWWTPAATMTGVPRLFPYSKHWLRHPWDRVRNSLGYGDDKGFVIHALRHTCASRLAQGGANVKVIMEWMGHKSITVTNRYMHLSPATLNGAVALLTRPDVKSDAAPHAAA